ncbi:hypothetical protein OV450_8319 [Actinobacteria bacterium OV450]|nr:hypothetical protein OV450_8319 [Actinobacteria bacterium OV450]
MPYRRAGRIPRSRVRVTRPGNRPRGSAGAGPGFAGAGPGPGPRRQASSRLAIAAGALAGGLAVDGIGAPTAPLTGAALMLLAAATATLTVTVRMPTATTADHQTGWIGQFGHPA